MGMKVCRDSAESEESEGRTLQKGYCGMSKTEKERRSEENSAGAGGGTRRSSTVEAEEEVINNCYIISREKKGKGRKIPPDLAN